MHVHNLLSRYMGQYADYAWVLHGAIILIVCFLLYFFCRNIFKRLNARLANTHNIWDDSVISAFALPLTVFIWFLGFTLIAQYIVLDYDADAVGIYVSQVRDVGLLVLLIWFLWRLVGKIETKMLTPYSWRKPTDPTTVAIVGRLFRIIVLLILALIVMQMFGVSPTGLLAFGGGGAIVVGIAAQDILANFFGGLMIFMDKPFKVGDWISSPEKNIEGTVQHIGWRTTSLLSFEKRPIYVPNSVFTKIAIVNPQRMTNRRIETVVGLRYDDADKVEAIVDDIREMLKNHDGVDQKQTLMVHFVGFGASSLNINLYCFTKTTMWNIWRDIQQDVFIKILPIVEKHGAEVAFPTTTMHVPDGIEVKGANDGRS